MFTAYLSKFMFAKFCKHNKKDAVQLQFRTFVRYHTSDHPFADKFPEDTDFVNEVPDDDNDLGNDNNNIDLYGDIDVDDNDKNNDKNHDKNIDYNIF